MIIQGLAFYLFAAIIVASGFMVIVARNPVHSVLFLILAFFNAAGLFVMLRAEFLAMLLVIVYVGAVAVLFMFVVMMLDINFTELREGFLNYLPVGALIGIILFIELAMVYAGNKAGWAVAGQAAMPEPAKISNTHAIGEVLYTHYIYLFQAAGLILLVSMIGAIVLTLRSREGVRRQNVSVQVGRTREDAIEIVKVKPRAGI